MSSIHAKYNRMVEDLAYFVKHEQKLSDAEWRYTITDIIGGYGCSCTECDEVGKDYAMLEELQEEYRHEVAERKIKEAQLKLLGDW